MRKRLIVALAVLAAASIGGCGGSDESDRNVNQITRTYETYIEAVKSGDGKTACRLLTPALRRQAAKSVALGNRSKLQGASCDEAVSQGTLPQIQQAEPNLEDVEVKGNRASGFDPGEGLIGPQRVLFLRIDGDWKISRTVFFR